MFNELFTHLPWLYLLLSGENDAGLSYLAVAVVRKDNRAMNFTTLKGKKACLPGQYLLTFR
jgi:hypothetical protein